MSGEPSYQMLVCYTPHTTAADGKFVVREIKRFNPDVYIPEEPIRPREKIDAVYGHYERLLSGEVELEQGRPNREFHQTILEYLRQHRTQKNLYVHFLELFSLEEVRHLGRLFQSQRELEKLAWNHFYDGKLEDACERLFISFYLHADAVRIRAHTIQKNIASLGRDLRRRFPKLTEGRVLAWISDLYAPPIVQFNSSGHNVEEVKQTIPYTHLTHVDVIRGLLLHSPVDESILPHYFVENILEERYRDSVQDSVERFSLCRRASSKLSFGDVKVLASNARDPERFLESLNEIQISKVDLPRNIGGAIKQGLNLKSGPEIGEHIKLLKSAVFRGELSPNPTVEECVEFLRRIADENKTGDIRI